MAGGPWGAGTWDTGSWGESSGDISNPTGISAPTSVGTVIALPVTICNLSGLAATGEIGEEELVVGIGWGANYWGGPRGWGGLVSVDAQVEGLVGTTFVGTVVTKSENFIMLTSVTGVGGVGEPDVEGIATVTLTGVSSLGVVGTATIRAQAVFDVTGVAGTVALGEAEGLAGAKAYVTPVTATGQVGSVTHTGNANVYLTSVTGYGRVTRPLVWGLIDTSQNANWLPIAA